MEMKPDDFYTMTPRQFSNKVKGFTERENEKTREQWEVMRFSTTALINVQLAKKDKITPRQLVTFPWDKEEKKVYLTPEQFLNIIAE